MSVKIKKRVVRLVSFSLIFVVFFGLSTLILHSSEANASVLSRTLTVGSVGDDVTLLQKVLNALGKTIASKPEPGSPGNETNYYGSLTASAVQVLQCEKGIVCEGTPDTTGFGIVGPKTRTLLNSLLESFSNFFQSVSSISNVSPRSQLAALDGVDSGLVGWWKFDEGSGTIAADSSGNGNNGTLTNGPTWVAGKIGGAVSFDGVNDRVDLPLVGSIIPVSSNFTYSAWIKGVDLTGYILGDGDASDLQVQNGAGVWLIYDQNFEVVQGTKNISDDNWHHIVGKREGIVGKLYIDGVEEGQASTISGVPDYIGVQTIGTRSVGATDPDNFYSGLIDDVRIYSRALSPSEIIELYNYTGGTPPPAQYTLTVSRSGTGSGTVSGGTISCGSTCSQTANSGTFITLTASPAGGSALAGWSGGGCSGTGICSIILSSNTAITANFNLSSSPDTTAPSIPTALSSSNITQTGATISWTASTDNIGVTGYKVYRNSTQVGTVTSGTSYTDSSLSANTTYSYTVSAYDGAGNNSAQSSPLSITTLTQAPTTYTLTVSKSGTGTGTITGGSISCGSTCSQTANSGTSITLTASPTSGSTFTGWSGGSCSGTGTCSITLNSNTTITAGFTLQTSGTTEWYVSPTGSPSGNGSISNPWDLQTALNQPSSVKPGDTLWLRGGNYVPPFIGYTSNLLGNAANYITVRPYTSERVILWGRLIVTQPYVIFRNLEITHDHTPYAGPSYPTRDAFEADRGVNYPQSGVGIQADYVKMINNTIYNVTEMNSSGADEWYGNLVSGVGAWFADGDSIGEGLYAHNDYAAGDNGNKADMENNIFAFGPRAGLNMWSAGVGQVRHMLAKSNIVLHFDLNSRSASTDVFDNVLDGNIVAGSVGDQDLSDPPALNVGWGDGLVYNETVTNNLLVSGSLNLTNVSHATVTGNTVCTDDPMNLQNLRIKNSDPTTIVFGTNVYYSTTPDNKFNISSGAVNGFFTFPVYKSNLLMLGGNDSASSFVQSVCIPTTKVYYFPNKYESGRMNIFVLNEEQKVSVQLDLSQSGLQSGDTYEVRYVNNYWGNKITGTYNGATVSLPMTGWATAQPKFLTVAQAGGLSKPNYTDPMPLWGAFVLIKTGSGGGTPPPTQYTLTISKSGTGSGTITGGTISCGSICSQTANSGTAVTLSAVPASGSSFTGWSGGSCSGTGSCTVTLNGNTTVTATFALVPDTTSPTISLTSPTNGSTVSNTVSLSATASDNVGVIGVQFKLDSQNIGSELTTAPYSGSWNTTGVSNGSHTLTAIARDAAGNRATSTPVSITVSNILPDTTPPTIPTLTATPASPSQINLSWNSSTDPTVVNHTTSGISGYRLYRNGTLLTSLSGTSYSDSSLTPSTSYSYTVLSYDIAGNTSSQSNSVSATTQALPPPPNPPVPSNGAPQSALPVNTTSTTLSLTTDISATCKYGTTPNTSFASLPTTFTTTGSQNHSTTISNLQNGSSYSYYVRCQSIPGVAMTGDYIISFSVSNPPPPPVTPPPASGGGGGSPSTGSGQGSSVPPPSSGGGGGSSTPPASSPTGTFTPTVPQTASTSGGVSSSCTSRLTSAQISAILGLLSSFNADQKIIDNVHASLCGQSVSSSSSPVTSSTLQVTSSVFSKSLKLGQTDPDVKQLQSFLNNHGFRISYTGVGSIGKETTYFGPATYQALIKFQEFYAEKILTPNNLSKGTGFFGPATMKVVNEMME